MLKINLLPAYIYERRKARTAIVLVSVITLLVLGVMLGWIYQLNRSGEKWRADVADMEAKRDAVLKLKDEVTAAQAKIPAVQGKVDYIQGVLNYNLQLPLLYERAVRYVYSRAELNSMSISGPSLTMAGHVRTLGDFGRLLMSLYSATDMFSAVSVTCQIPGWPSPLLGTSAGSGLPTAGFDFNATCTLVTPMTAAPAFGGATGGGGGGAGPGGGGSLGGMTLPGMGEGH